MNCWDFKKCSEPTKNECPAYPGHGLDCWKVTGHKCALGQLKMKTLAQKIEYCRDCEFYIKYAVKY